MVLCFGVESESNPVHIVVAQLPDDGVVADVRVLRITIRTLHCRYTRGNALLLVIRFLLTLDLVHTFSIILLTSSNVRAVTSIDVIEQTRSYP